MNTLHLQFLTRPAGLLYGGLLCAVILFGAQGCCSSDQSTAGVFSLSLSSGGGFSGMITGFSIDAGGNIFYHRAMKGEREISDRLGTLTREDRNWIAEKMRACDITRIQAKGSGNMMSALEGVLDGQTFSMSWFGADSDADTVPKAVKPVFEALQMLLQEYREKAMTGGFPMHTVEVK